MKVCAWRFNIYFALAVAALLVSGCQTDKKDAQDKKVAALRIHLEVNDDHTDVTGTSQTISVLRADPVQITISRDPILTEANIIAARVINTPGGFAIEVRFDEIGALTLEQYTGSNPGTHLAIFGQWGDKLANGRWLAAPMITHRIANGVLAFTPDCSRAEADELVLGLNNVAAKIKKQQD
jgi:preprotein translocase subunit SecD